MTAEWQGEADAQARAFVAGWRRADVAELMGTEPARVSDLRRGKLDRFSLETLIRFLTRLRRDVELRVVKGSQALDRSLPRGR